MFFLKMGLRSHIKPSRPKAKSPRTPTRIDAAECRSAEKPETGEACFMSIGLSGVCEFMQGFREPEEGGLRALFFFAGQPRLPLEQKSP